MRNFGNFPEVWRLGSNAFENVLRSDGTNTWDKTLNAIWLASGKEPLAFVAVSSLDRLIWRSRIDGKWSAPTPVASVTVGRSSYLYIGGSVARPTLQICETEARGDDLRDVCQRIESQ